jgi:hypothetical protein
MFDYRHVRRQPERKRHVGRQAVGVTGQQSGCCCLALSDSCAVRPPSLVCGAISNNYQLYRLANKFLMIWFVVDVVLLILKT